MTQHPILGTALLIDGAILLVIGMKASHSMAFQLGNTLTGRITDNTTLCIVSGMAAGIVGLSMLFLCQRGGNESRRY